MDGRVIFDFVIKEVLKSINYFIEIFYLEKEDIDYFFLY